MRCHPFVLKELFAANNPDEKEGLVQFDKALFAHIGFAISNFFRTLGFNYGGSFGWLSILWMKPVNITVQCSVTVQIWRFV